MLPRPSPLALYAAGTVVAESFFELSAIGLDHEPWTDPRLTGLVDFPELHVAPGSWRGVIPDAVAPDFAQALLRVEPRLAGVLETRERERAEKLDQTLIRDLQRAFRDFYQRRPSYTMLPAEAAAPAGGVEKGNGPAPGALAESESEPVPAPTTGAETAELFPPGPLETVAIAPKRVLLVANGERAARAEAFDASGRKIRDGIRYEWELWGRVGALREEAGTDARIVVAASEEPGEGILSVHARRRFRPRRLGRRSRGSRRRAPGGRERGHSGARARGRVRRELALPIPRGALGRSIPATRTSRRTPSVPRSSFVTWRCCSRRRSFFARVRTHGSRPRWSSSSRWRRTPTASSRSAPRVAGEARRERGTE